MICNIKKLKIWIAELPSLLEGKIKTKRRQWIAKRQGLWNLDESGFSLNVYIFKKNFESISQNYLSVPFLNMYYVPGL